MQTSFEILFVLAFVLPPLAVIAGICAVLGPSFVYWRSHVEARHAVRSGAVAIDHPVGR